MIPAVKAWGGAAAGRLRAAAERGRETVRRLRTEADRLRPVRGAPEDPADFGIGRQRRAGWALIGIFVVGGTIWASVTRLEGAAIAAGVVGVESNRKSLAHLEGGIVREILVREGDHVAAGQPLLRLDTTMAGAALDLLKSREAALIARRARLQAEQSGQQSIALPPELLDQADRAEIVDLIEGELKVFETRIDNLKAEGRVLGERIAKHRTEIAGLKSVKASTERRLKLLRDEHAMIADLLKEGLVPRKRGLELERQIADSEGEIGEFAAQIARAGEAISEIEMQSALTRERHLKEVSRELQDVREQLAETRERLRAAQDVLERTEVKAPQAGTVVALSIHTLGGVVRAGEPLLDLVPDDDRYVVNLRIDPRDIDVVYPGMPARVRLTAFNARTTPTLEGRVSTVSADRLVDPDTGIAFFTGRVEPELTEDARHPKLTPGMQAEVFLVTAERTVLDYLLDPMVRALDRAGREP